MVVEISGPVHTGAILFGGRLREAAIRWLDVSSHGNLDSARLVGFPFLVSWLQCLGGPHPFHDIPILVRVHARRVRGTFARPGRCWRAMLQTGILVRDSMELPGPLFSPRSLAFPCTELHSPGASDDHDSLWPRFGEIRGSPWRISRHLNINVLLQSCLGYGFVQRVVCSSSVVRSGTSHRRNPTTIKA